MCFSQGLLVRTPSFALFHVADWKVKLTGHSLRGLIQVGREKEMTPWEWEQNCSVVESCQVEAHLKGIVGFSLFLRALVMNIIMAESWPELLQTQLFLPSRPCHGLLRACWWDQDASGSKLAVARDGDGHICFPARWKWLFEGHLRKSSMWQSPFRHGSPVTWANSAAYSLAQLCFALWAAWKCVRFKRWASLWYICRYHRGLWHVLGRESGEVKKGVSSLGDISKKHWLSVKFRKLWLAGFLLERAITTKGNDRNEGEGAH